jgi:site-specific recombinase XerD
LAEVQLVDVQAFIDSLAPLKVSSQARAVAALKSCLSFAVKTGYLQFNVGAVLKLPKSENTLAERIMSEQAVARMLAKEENQRNHAILVLLYRAGLRAQDVSAYSGGTFSRVIIVVSLRSMAKGRRHASCCSIREYGTNYRRCGQPVSILMPMFSNHGNRELAQAKRTANLTPA